jgi:hypothetical protein
LLGLRGSKLGRGLIEHRFLEDAVAPEGAPPSDLRLNVRRSVPFADEGFIDPVAIRTRQAFPLHNAVQLFSLD